MRVGIDARLASRGLGIATALHGLAPAVSEMADVIWIGDPTAAPASVEDCIAPPRPFPALDLNPRFVRGARLDVLHFAANMGWMWRGPVPSVLTIHDMIFMSSGLRGVASARQLIGHRYMSLNVRLAVHAASVVAVPSRATASEVERRLRCSSPARVIPWGLTPPDGPSPKRRRAERDYALAFAAPSPRKRLDVVLEAWRTIWPEMGIELWLLGGGDRGSDAGVTDVSRGIRQLGYLGRDELWDVMSRAFALVYPSEQEGFGFPVLEGFAAGTPVLTGLASATRELGGNAVLRLDASAPAQSIVDGIQRLRHDSELRRGLVEEGRTRAAGYSWSAAAEAYVEAYEAAIRLG